MQVGQTQRVVELSREHYEPMAVGSGTLARLLQDYLEARVYNLLLYYENRQALAERLEEIARQTASNSFFYFCRLLSAFDAFASQASGTYLFTDPKVSDRLRRLHNVFIRSLPRGTWSDAIDVYHILDMLRDKNVAGYQINMFRKLVQQPKENKSDSLQREFDAYTAWILEASPQVAKATGALSAFSSLLRGQLEAIQAAWGEGGGATVTVVDRRSGWWAAIADDSAMAESDLPRPLGLLTSIDPDESNVSKIEGFTPRDQPEEKLRAPESGKPVGHTGGGGLAGDDQKSPDADAHRGIVRLWDPKSRGKLRDALSPLLPNDLFDLVVYQIGREGAEAAFAWKEKTSKDLARDIVEAAYREEWLPELLVEARKKRPRNKDLYLLATKAELTSRSHQ